ncbi:MAG TPA: hypothetical protein VF601_12850 [Beijerinckiaceae bacterium]
MQFEFERGRLIVLHQSSFSKSQDKNNILSAKEELLKKGAEILSALRASNCDNRLLQTVEYLQKQLNKETNIITIGLSNIGCAVMSDMYQHELPDALNGMLRAHTVGVEMYVAQFPDWARFVENASAAQIDSNDVAQIHRVTSQLVAQLQAKPEMVDPEVPKTFARLNELIAAPSNAAKRAAFAVLRSIENLISKVFSYGANLLDATANKTVEGVSSVLSKALIVAMLTLALDGALGITSIAAKIHEMTWLKNAVELVQKQLQTMK